MKDYQTYLIIYYSLILILGTGEDTDAAANENESPSKTVKGKTGRKPAQKAKTTAQELVADNGNYTKEDLFLYKIKNILLSRRRK